MAAEQGGWSFSPDPRVEDMISRVFRECPPLSNPGLDRFHAYLSALGNPHLSLPPVFHVAGTNGKGSTSAFLRAGLEAAGLSVHAFLSPHLVRFEERISLNGRLIDGDALARFISLCLEAAQGREVSFFEFFNGLAFLAFSRIPADAVVLETGLGGLHDSTNVVPLSTAVLTRISFDHTQILGNTLPLIAAQKAGILKRGGTAISAPQPGEGVNAVFEREAARLGVPLFSAPRDWHVEAAAEGFVYHGTKEKLALPEPSLLGAHQYENAGAAISALLHSPFANLMTPAVLSAAVTRARWPGRLQRLISGPLLQYLPEGWEIWIDGAHNDSGAEVLARHAKTSWSDRPLDIVAAMKDKKDPAVFFKTLSPVVDKAVALSGPFGKDVDTAAPMMPVEDVRMSMRSHGLPGAQAAKSPREAIALLTNDSKSSGPRRILFTGSLYLAGFLLRDHA